MTLYTGGCQCGAVTFEADTEISKVISCNCSRCSKLGGLLSAMPAAKFRLTRGQEALTEFRFNKHVIRHYFCAACGIQPFAQGKGRDSSDMVMINVRCVDGIDPDTLPVQHFDGRGM